MILEELMQLIFYSIIWFFIAIFAIVFLVWAFLDVKKKLTDMFGHELKNRNANVRKAYVMKLNDEEMLKKVALSDYNQDVGVEAVERINTKSYLEEIAECDKFRVSRAAERRIEEL